MHAASDHAKPPEKPVLLTQPGGETSSWAKGNARVAAYYHCRARARTRVKPAAEEVLQQWQPTVAGELMQHQLLPCRGTPHPLEGAQRRWPETGCAVGGLAAPLDSRQHANWFGYRQQRWKRHWAQVPELIEEADFTLTLEDLKVLLAQRFGSLLTAFQHLDFFRHSARSVYNVNDSNLSLVEWQEGLYDVFSTLPGEKYAALRGLCEPRWRFNKRLKKMFQEMDRNGDGLITFEELSAPRAEVSETQREFTLRRTAELLATHSSASPDGQPHAGTVPRAQSSSDLALASIADLAEAAQAAPPAHQVAAGDGNARSASTELLRSFAALLIHKFPNLEAAFEAMDHSRNGKLSQAEFSQGAKHLLRFAGDTKAIFKELDTDSDGTISAREFMLLRALSQGEETAVAATTLTTKRDVVAARRKRSPIASPEPYSRGVCLASLEIPRPRGERMTSSSGFYCFERSATGRLDGQLHPNELPGVDQENFTELHGPGFVSQGPEHFAEVACIEHPLRGSGWKLGATLGRAARFGPAIPSAQGRQDRELSAAGFLAHAGRHPAEAPERRSRMPASAARSPAPRGPGMGPWREPRSALGPRAWSSPGLLRGAR